MIYTLVAKVSEYTKEIEVEADSLEEAKEKLTEDVDNGIVEIEPSQVINIEILPACPGSVHGHRWEASPHNENELWCHYCGAIQGT